MACETEQTAYDRGLAKVAVRQAELIVGQAETIYAQTRLDQAQAELGRLRMRLDDCKNGCACTIPEPDESALDTMHASLESTMEELYVVRSDLRAALDALG